MPRDKRDERKVTIEDVGVKFIEAYGQKWMVDGSVHRLQVQDIGKRIILKDGRLCLEDGRKLS